MQSVLSWRGLLLLAWFGATGLAGQLEASREKRPNRSIKQERGADVGMAFLLQYYKELPHRRPGEKPAVWADRWHEALGQYKKNLESRYTEGTLQRLLQSHQAKTRRAAVLGLGLIGSIQSNQAVAAMLHDEDFRVRLHATDALWQLWFRGDRPVFNQELQRLVQLANEEEEGNGHKALTGLNALIQKAPRFAEAYNQRAVIHFQLGQLDKSIADCEATLKLNPYHFGAASGMGRCFMKLKKPKAALKAYRAAYRINPGMQDVGEAIRFLESVLGEEGKK